MGEIFISFFLNGLIISTFSILTILLIRNWMKNQIKAQSLNHLWILLFLTLLIPLCPIPLPSLFSAQPQIPELQKEGTTVAIEENQAVMTNEFIKDFSVSVQRIDFSFLNVPLMILWLLGVFVLLSLLLISFFALKRLKAQTQPVEDPNIKALFLSCKKRLGIKRTIDVRYSTETHSPLIFGLFHSVVVIPKKEQSWLTMTDYENIFLHELSHYKNKDLLTNYVMIFFQVIYWFNPLIWIASKRMKADREMACDEAVLQLLYHDKAVVRYGHTMINFASTMQRKLPLTAEFTSGKRQMKERIERIAAFRTKKAYSLKKTVCFYTLTLFILIAQLPFVSALEIGAEETYDFQNESIIERNLSPFFQGFEGSFVLYDEAKNQYVIHNRENGMKRISPDSTYKIYSALFALDAGYIMEEASTLSWDGRNQPFAAWNQDHNLTSALQNSVNWYFQRLDTMAGEEALQTNLQRIHYGNTDTSGGVKDFWNESSLKISPVEQVELLQSFYHHQLGFKKEHTAKVQDALLIESHTGYRLYGKTGTGTINGINKNGWFIGYVETKQTTYFFATNIQDEGEPDGQKAIQITRDILKELGIYESKEAQ
ncbi:BlaR1 family beta-lactam sensor/signal transducer [Cytobacillus kochii]|uniref:BlaR1 family beta-lactam sensor/signal transducer n=1 Tax=Cytobacillus kochii TaxID=859143 RepID=UPI002E20DF4B|nr:BlaR1 family beta-lactam sensor/signal transducer [Cytobacillus kochii]MED1607891.1 BlaR1 family beta-lactam sensor/signal transducer [Cytobacillus kochii]